MGARTKGCVPSSVLEGGPEGCESGILDWCATVVTWEPI